ncbi:MAG: hypothetical protein GX579_22330 [Chloroflexi bacterium]|jgi:hypothetical protein|nr:hypothetical protein [Chloroflexota bacterium]
MPTTKKIWLWLLLILLLALAACGGEDEGEGEADPQDLAEPPQIYLLTEDGRLESFSANYCWQVEAEAPADFEAATERCGETTMPTFEGAAYTTVAVGEPFRLEMEEPLPERVTLALSPPDNIFAETSADENTIEEPILVWTPADVPAGNYILIALAYWPEAGGAVYYYPVTLE